MLNFAAIAGKSCGPTEESQKIASNRLSILNNLVANTYRRHVKYGLTIPRRDAERLLTSAR